MATEVPWALIGARTFGLKDINAALAAAEQLTIPKALVDPGGNLRGRTGLEPANDAIAPTALAPVYCPACFSAASITCAKTLKGWAPEISCATFI